MIFFLFIYIYRYFFFTSDSASGIFSCTKIRIRLFTDDVASVNICSPAKRNNKPEANKSVLISKAKEKLFILFFFK